MTERHSKVYRGYSEDAGSAMGPVAVTVEHPPGVVKRLRHEVRHSRSGFSWGYAGSGPADLARSILADYLGYIPHPSIYQQFKFQHVARWEEGKSWKIDAPEIDLFLHQPGIRQLVEQQLQDDQEEL